MVPGVLHNVFSSKPRKGVSEARSGRTKSAELETDGVG